MTIQIRQLIIRAVVEARPEGAQRSMEPASGQQPALTTHSDSASVSHPEDREAIVATCVREVLRELRKGRER